jgi:hypothetical protein
LHPARVILATPNDTPWFGGAPSAALALGFRPPPPPPMGMTPPLPPGYKLPAGRPARNMADARSGPPVLPAMPPPPPNENAGTEGVQTTQMVAIVPGLRLPAPSYESLFPPEDEADMQDTLNP